METETRSLKCNLTVVEVQKLLGDAARMTVEDKAAAQQNIDSAAARLKSAKSCMEALQSTIDAKLDTANRGWESRQVECHWRIDRTAGVKRLIRSDTGEVVETVDMPRQQTIDGVVSSSAKPQIAAELDGVEVGQYGEGYDGRHYRVDAVAPDSVVIVYASGESERISAREWPHSAPAPDVDQQEYRDAFEAEKGGDEEEEIAPPNATPGTPDWAYRIRRVMTSEPVSMSQLTSMLGDGVPTAAVLRRVLDGMGDVVREGEKRGTTYRLTEPTNED